MENTKSKLVLLFLLLLHHHRFSLRSFFGNKESSTSDVFASIFPPQKGMGNSSPDSEWTGSWQKQPSGNQSWNAKLDTMDKNHGVGYHNKANNEKSSAFYGERVEPSYLSSSLFYGGQETYSESSYSRSPASYFTFKKDAGEDDPTSASRGNWWQGNKVRCITKFLHLMHAC